MYKARAVIEKRVGAGRSAVVYLDHDQQGRPLARKIFTGEAASKLVLYVLTGSANPYTWCEAAMACAVIRRRILSSLTRVWFGKRLRLPRHDGWGWNRQYRAFELSSELIDGCHAPLRLPENTDEVDYLNDLLIRVMKPLQHHLIEAGFDGLAWQAGKGNPVATNNFMLERDQGDGLRWVWIDLESGVPALFALNPLATLGFYLPKSWHHRRWLFDDVDTNKLQTYLHTHKALIVSKLEAGTWERLLADVTALEKEQTAWRSLRRFQRNIAYERSRERISEEQARWYNTRAIRWYLHVIPVTGLRVIKSLYNGIGQLAMRVWKFPFRRLARRLLHYLTSSRYRWGIARWFVSGSINSWLKRGFIKQETAQRLQHELKQNEASSYLADFSVHLVIVKPLVKVIQWGILPTLWVTGVISELTFGLLLVTGGSIGRTFYTLSRMFQALLMLQRLPWVALLVGTLPMAGNAAYPMQLLYSSTGHTGNLARFIVYDIAARIGRGIPIWGGADTQMEHFANRSCDVIVRMLVKLIGMPALKPGQG